MSGAWPRFPPFLSVYISLPICPLAFWASFPISKVECRVFMAQIDFGIS